MIIPMIRADQARSFKHRFDSTLELPSGTDVTQNAWLTVNLRIFFNFVSPSDQRTFQVQRPLKGPLVAPISRVDGVAYARDSEGWLYPILDWQERKKKEFRTAFLAHGEKVWNYQFTLMTPPNCEELDIDCKARPSYRLRPNLACLFRLEEAPSPANCHWPVNVFSIDPTAREIKNENPVQGSLHLSNSDSPAEFFGASLGNLADFVKDGKIPPRKEEVYGHEIGHALGFGHVRSLGITESHNPDITSEDRKNITSINIDAIKRCSLDSPTANEPDCYGVTQLQMRNIMGVGFAIYVENAGPWTARAEEHVVNPTKQYRWTPTGKGCRPVLILRAQVRLP